MMESWPEEYDAGGVVSLDIADQHCFELVDSDGTNLRSCDLPRIDHFEFPDGFV